MSILELQVPHRRKYTGTIVCISQHTAWFGKRRTVCLGEVYTSRGVWVTDHAWVPASEFPPAQVLKYGMVLAFTAELDHYIRGGGFRTRKFHRIGYRFVNIRDCAIIHYEYEYEEQEA